MDDNTTTYSIEDLVHEFQRKKLSRTGFIAALAGLGASASSIATLAAAAEVDAAALPPRRVLSQAAALERENTTLHHAHVQRQSRATQQGAALAEGPSEAQVRRLETIMADYADDAVVDDPLYETPIVGKKAIGERKLAEMRSMSGATIDVTSRLAHGDQVLAEWIVRGTHQGDLLGFRATGRAIEVHGVTVVTRRKGKIVRESLYYDLADLHRQLG
jgi:steroid delta-isomerase-like uncharacterized protein